MPTIFTSIFTSRINRVLTLLSLFVLVSMYGEAIKECCGVSGNRVQAAEESKAPSRLCVLWTSRDPDVAKNVCFMYTRAAKQAKWFDEVYLVVWGPSAKLLAENKSLQAEVKSMQAAGVVTEACIVCAKRYDAAEKLKKLGLDVKGMGKPLSDRLKADWKILTF